MPYIAINTSQKLSAPQKEKIKTEIGRLITIIPNKTEAVTYVDFSDSRTAYMGGVEISGAFIDLRLFHQSDSEAKKKFTEETLAMLSKELGIAIENIYMSILEFNDWGSRGKYKS